MDAAGIVDKTSQAKARQSTRQSATTIVIVIIIIIMTIIMTIIIIIIIMSNAAFPIKTQMNPPARVRSPKSEIERKLCDEISGGLKSWH